MVLLSATGKVDTRIKTKIVEGKKMPRQKQRKNARKVERELRSKGKTFRTWDPVFSPTKDTCTQDGLQRTQGKR